MNYSVSKFILKSCGFQQGAVLALRGHLAIPGDNLGTPTGVGV